VNDALEKMGYVALAVLAYLSVALLATLMLGRIELAWVLAKGFLMLWVFLYLEQIVQAIVQKTFHLSELEHLGVVLFNLFLTVGFCLAWSAFLALEVTRAANGWLGVGVLHLLGLVGAWLGFGVITSFFTGTLYRMTGLAVAVLGYGGFAIFPASAQDIFGWFFALGQ
jgi:hypothetical protein